MTIRNKMTAVRLSTIVFPFLLASKLATAQHELYKILAPDGQAGDSLGESVAIDEDCVLVGAAGDDENGSSSGSAYVFQVSTGQFRVKLLPMDGAPGDSFGWSTAIHGQHAIVGSIGDSDLGNYTGSAYIFDVMTGVQVHKLLASDGAAGDYFGFSVAISGERAVVGAPNDDDLGGSSGSVYVFDVASGTQLLKLLPQSGSVAALFGHSVAIRNDRIVVGANQHIETGGRTGAAYVFDATNGTQLFKLLASDGEAGDSFGSSVAVDGNLVVIGAAGDRDVETGAGSAYIFDLTTAEELHKLLPTSTYYGAHFGWTVSVSGKRTMIGAWEDHENGNFSGAAYLFDATNGQLLQKCLASDGGSQDGFGLGLDIWGNRAVIGAYGTDDLGSNSGSAYVFSAMGDPGHGYCTGDPGSGAPCPCGNDNDGSVRGSGCANGVFASGAHLIGSGDASLGADTLALSATGLEPNNFGLYFQASDAINGGNGQVFGDGLRCAGGAVIRLEIRQANGAGASSTTVPIAIQGGVFAGDTKRYQLWYRTIASPPCGAGVNDFNLSNGYEIVWSL